MLYVLFYMYSKYKIMEAGDWKCSCGEVNFKKRNGCRKCGKSKNGTGRSGDWNCSCGELNFSSRSKCRKCDNSKPSNLGNSLPYQQPKAEMKFGDWICPNNACNEHNFKVRDICRKCNTPKSSNNSNNNPNDNSNNPNDNLNNTDNTCVVCLDQPKTHAIIKCGHLCYCGICGFNLDKCPICREKYNPDTDMIKIYNI